MGWVPGAAPQGPRHRAREDEVPGAAPQGPRHRASEDESTRQKPQVGGQLMLFIYTTRVTSRMMRYKHWTPGEVESAVRGGHLSR